MGAQDGVIFAHFFGKRHFFYGRASDSSFYCLPFFHPDGGNQGADTDTGGSQVIHLVDFQAGVDLAAVFQNLMYLVCGHSVQAASERIQLNQVQVLSGLDKIGSRIQTGMVHPLVIDPQRPFQGPQMGHGIFCQHRHAIAVDQFGNPVVDLRIDMVGASCQHNAVPSGFFQITQGFFSFFHQIPAGKLQLFPCCLCCLCHFLFRYIRKRFNQSLCQHIQSGKGQKRIAKMDGWIVQLFHVVFDIFRIGGHNGAVIMIDRIGKLLPLIRNTGVEDKFHALFQQPGYMPMGQFGRVTL